MVLVDTSVWIAHFRKGQPVLVDLLSDGIVVMRLVEERRRWGRGLGWIDAHLLAAALISNCRFWTLDKRLRNAASELGLG
jgi:predicted nucleic acid-binding protein